MKAKPVMVRVPGAPHQPGDRAVFIGMVDSQCDQIEVGEVGVVVYLEYSCGCGQVYPESPMLGISFGGRMVEVWPEEVSSETEEKDGPVLVLDIGDDADWIRKRRKWKGGKSWLTVG